MSAHQAAKFVNPRDRRDSRHERPVILECREPGHFQPVSTRAIHPRSDVEEISRVADSEVGVRPIVRDVVERHLIGHDRNDVRVQRAACQVDFFDVKSVHGILDSIDLRIVPTPLTDSE